MRRRIDNGQVFERLLLPALEHVGLEVEHQEGWDLFRKVDFVIRGVGSRSLPKFIEVQFTLRADNIQKIRGFMNAVPVFPNSLKLYAEASAYDPHAVARALALVAAREDLSQAPQCVRIEDERVLGPWDMKAHLKHLALMLDPANPKRQFGKVARLDPQTRQAFIRVRGGRLLPHRLDRISDYSLRGKLVSMSHHKGYPSVPVTFIPFQHENRWFASYLLAA